MTKKGDAVAKTKDIVIITKVTCVIAVTCRLKSETAGRPISIFSVWDKMVDTVYGRIIITVELRAIATRQSISSTSADIKANQNSNMNL